MSLFAMAAGGALGGAALGSALGGDDDSKDLMRMQYYIAQQQQKALEKGVDAAKDDLGYLDIGEDMLNQYMIEAGQREGESRFEMNPMWQAIQQEKRDALAQELSNTGMMFTGAGQRELAETSATVKGNAYQNYMNQLDHLMGIGRQTTSDLVNLDMMKVGGQRELLGTQSNLLANQQMAENNWRNQRNQNIMGGLMSGAQLGMGMSNSSAFQGMMNPAGIGG